MKNLIIVIVLGLIACGKPGKVVQVNDKVKSSITHDSVSVISKKYNNPVFFMGTGTSFGLYFQVLFKLGQFSRMLDFTSTQTIRKYGRQRILRFYSEELKFGFRLGQLTSLNKSESITTLNYANSKEFATKRVTRFHVVIENDSCKILLDKLNPNPF